MKAISLLSGGLDSTLATKIVKEQGIDVIAVNFKSPFCLCDGSKKAGCRHMAVEMAKQLDVPLKVIYLGDEYLEIIKNPKYGYGSGINPCIDCRILKLKKAKELMEEIGASFIITGEVLGQRPMSQNKRAMEIIEKESGLKGLIVRPLCAKVLPESIPEKNKWVDREKFYEIKGRRRKEQLRLTAELKISDYACPAGGCLLTDKFYSLKIRDLIDSDMFNLETIKLTKYGRYYSISKDFKLIIGRNEIENNLIAGLKRENDILFIPDCKGPIALGIGKISDNEIEIAAKLCASFCKRQFDTAIRCMSKNYQKIIIINEKFDTDLLFNEYKLK